MINKIKTSVSVARIYVNDLGYLWSNFRKEELGIDYEYGFRYLPQLISFYDNNLFKKILLFLFTWLIFFALFKVSVNKIISTKAAFISSFLTLATLSITKNLFIYYVVYNKTYTTIYGSLSTLLFSILWIYISWIIYLYGIKICHKLNMKYLNQVV